MKKKAATLVELILLLSVVTVAALVLTGIFNNLKRPDGPLMKMSTVTPRANTSE